MSDASVTHIRRPRGKLRGETITLSHGAGGKAMHDLIEDLFVSGFDNRELDLLEDQARFDLASVTARGDRLALTTDSYVVDPLFFPGGDIGKLAVTGTVNDLAVGGAIPLWLTCGMIIEEGLTVEELRRVVTSMKQAADEAGVRIVTGDTKVVHKGAADKLFINTAGVGVIPKGVEINARRARPGDRIIINGYIGDHGAVAETHDGTLAELLFYLAQCLGECFLAVVIHCFCHPVGEIVVARPGAPIGLIDGPCGPPPEISGRNYSTKNCT